MKNYFTYLLWFIGIIFIQTFVFDYLVLPGGFTISFYILFLLILPFHTSISILMIFGFFLGLVVDMPNDTYGLHASSALALGAFRRRIYSWFEPTIGYSETQSPNINDMGLKWLLKSYTLSILVYYIWFYAISYLRMSGILFTTQKILLSTISTMFVIVLAQLVFRRKAKKNEF